MLSAIQIAEEKKLSSEDISHCFENIAVPRKEIIYSLVDLKVGRVPKKDRLRYIHFWWDVVTQQCIQDCLVQKSNIVHTKQQIDDYIQTLPWVPTTPEKSRQIGNLAMNLNSLSYGLYTDVFAHMAMENFGAYDVSSHFHNTKHILVIKQWANLKPVEIFPEFTSFPFHKLNLYAIYKDINYTVDIYTHQVYSGSAGKSLVQYCAVIDDKQFLNTAAEINKLNSYLGTTVVEHYQKIQKRGFEEAKKIWVLARNYQFKKFFEAVGLEWYDKEMLNRVKDKQLLKTRFWDFDAYSKEILFTFWKQCFDPRLDTYYDTWETLLQNIVSANR